MVQFPGCLTAQLGIKPLCFVFTKRWKDDLSLYLRGCNTVFIVLIYIKKGLESCPNDNLDVITFTVMIKCLVFYLTCKYVVLDIKTNWHEFRGNQLHWVTVFFWHGIVLNCFWNIGNLSWDLFTVKVDCAHIYSICIPCIVTTFLLVAL